MKAVARVLLPLLLLLAPLFLRAEIVRDLYSAQVPVADQGAQALARASRDALAEVLVKVSGSVDVLQYPVIQVALKEARGHVQQYAYVRGDSSEEQLLARFEFDGPYVTELVKRAGAPLWTANRPSVLLWLVVEDPQGRYFVSWERAPELSQQLLTAFARRGVPVQLPLFDLADSSAISLDEAWRLYGPAVQNASARYGTQDVMAGRIASLSTGGSVGDWSYFYAGDRLDRSVTASDLEVFVAEGAAIVAEEMAARYAVAASGTTGGGVGMSVSGVSSYADYAGIVAWLEGLELIEHANVELIQGDHIELRLHAEADASQLTTIIELNERLLPLPPSIPGSELNYQWQN
jgi:hypothetical protein